MGTSRICPKCSGYFDVANWICPHCGAEFSAPRPTRPGWLQKAAPHPGALTKIVMGVTAAVFVIQGLLGSPIIDSDWSVLYAMGSMVPERVAAGEHWRLVTPMLLHDGILHILFNMFALFQLGPLVEQAYGRSRFLVIYLVTGVTCSLASMAFGTGGVGASGAVCGLLGIMASWGKRRGGVEGALIRRTMIRWAVFILIYGLLAEHVNNYGHAGGFFGGLALGMVITPKGFKLETGQRRRIWSAAAAGVVVIFALSATAAAMNVVNVRRIEKLDPQIQAVHRTLNRAGRLFILADTERLLMSEPAGLSERTCADLRNGFLAMEDELRDVTPRLGGDATRAVDLAEKAFRLRAREFTALIGARAPITSEASGIWRQVRPVWKAYLDSIGYE